MPALLYPGTVGGSNICPAVRGRERRRTQRTPPRRIRVSASFSCSRSSLDYANAPRWLWPRSLLGSGVNRGPFRPRPPRLWAARVLSPLQKKSESSSGSHGTRGEALDALAGTLRATANPDATPATNLDPETDTLVRNTVETPDPRRHSSKNNIRSLLANDS